MHSEVSSWLLKLRNKLYNKQLLQGNFSYHKLMSPRRCRTIHCSRMIMALFPYPLHLINPLKAHLDYSWSRDLTRGCERIEVRLVLCVQRINTLNGDDQVLLLYQNRGHTDNGLRARVACGDLMVVMATAKCKWSFHVCLKLSPCFI